MGDTFFSLADLVSRLVQGGGIADLAGAVSDDARRKLAEVVSRIRHDFAVDTNVLVLRSLHQVAPAAILDKRLRSQQDARGLLQRLAAAVLTAQRLPARAPTGSGIDTGAAPVRAGPLQ